MLNLTANNVSITKVDNGVYSKSCDRFTARLNKPLPLILVKNQYVCIRNKNNDIIFEGYVDSVGTYSFSLASYFKFDSEFLCIK